MSSVPRVQQALRRPEPLEETYLGRVAQIDRSLAPAALLLAGSAALWLVVASALALVGSLQLHLPGLLDAEVLTHGRLRELQSAALAYGWGFNAALAVALWISHRLGRVESRHAWVAVLGALGWNLALTWGALAILRGASTGVPGLELPRETGPFLAACFLCVGLWAAVAYARRQTGAVFVSQWYIVAAVLAFPVLHLLAHAAVLWFPSRGVVQALVSAWHAHGVFTLVLAPVALAALYYLIPKETGRPIRGYYMAGVAFWLFLACNAWAAPAHLLGSPVPVWLQSSGVVAAVMLVVPGLIAAIHFHGTLLRDGPAGPARGPAFRFAVAGATAFLLWIAGFAVLSTRGVSARLRFTEAEQALGVLGWHGFLTLSLLAALYYLLPRVARREWPSSALVSAHLWLSVLGAAVVAVALALLGWQRAAGPEDLAAAAPALSSAASLGFAVLLVGHLAFAGHLALLLLSPGRAGRDEAPLSAR